MILRHGCIGKTSLRLFMVTLAPMGLIFTTKNGCRVSRVTIKLYRIKSTTKLRLYDERATSMNQNYVLRLRKQGNPRIITDS